MSVAGVWLIYNTARAANDGYLLFAQNIASKKKHVATDTQASLALLGCALAHVTFTLG